jgi:hypothetical protein
MASPMTVTSSSGPLEPNDQRASATSLRLGEAACARFESGNDVDWYAFDGTAGERITVVVLCHGIGALADPSIQVRDPFDSLTALQDDVRPPALYRNQIEGEDLDVRMVGLELPSTGRWHLRLRNQRSAPSAAGFYVLLVTPSSESPSSALTEVRVDPARIDADGVSVATITVLPRKETGEPVGPGAHVSLAHGGVGVVGEVTDAGDGTYVVTIVSPTMPGTDRFDVRVTTAEGTAVVFDAATIHYLGPVDGSASEFVVTPRRIDADGKAQALVVLEPRDARGEELGPGRDVVFSVDGPPGTSVAGAVDLQDGSYVDTIKAPTMPGAGTVTAVVDGVALTRTARIDFGFPLADVFVDARADVENHLAAAGLAKKAAKTLRKASTVVAAALTDLSTGGSGAVYRSLPRAVRVMEFVAAARRRAGIALADPGTQRDLARAVREAAQKAIAASVIRTGRDQSRVDAANALLAAGDEAFASEHEVRAAKLWRRAAVRVRPLQP